jgi:hypothetical protein
MIIATAAKCRYCGEIFDPKLKKKAKARKRSNDDDEEMTTSDYIACFLCSGIACLVGIVYLIQGKRKGLKIVGISLAMVVFWNIVFTILNVVLQSGAQHGPR